MSLNALTWGPGRIFEHPFRGTPYDDQVNSHLWLWFIVDDESQVVQGFRLAGCRWRLIEALTSDREESYGVSESWGTMVDTGSPLYCLVYERVGEPPKCSKFS